MDPRVRDLDLDLDRLLRRAELPLPRFSIIRRVLEPKLSLSLFWEEAASEAAEASVAVDLPAVLPPPPMPPP